MKKFDCIEIIDGFYNGNQCKIRDINDKYIFVHISGSTVLFDVEDLDKKYKIVENSDDII